MVGRKYLLKPWMMICFTYILKEHARREFQLELPRHNAPGAKKKKKRKKRERAVSVKLDDSPCQRREKETEGYRGCVAANGEIELRER